MQLPDAPSPEKSTELVNKINDVLKELDNIFADKGKTSACSPALLHPLNLLKIPLILGASSASSELIQCDRRLLATLARHQLSKHLCLPPAAKEKEVEEQKEPLLPSRAVLIPCAGTKGPVVPMPYRQLTVGTGRSLPGNHIQMTRELTL